MHGVYLLEPRAAHFLFPLTTYGISHHGNHWYIAERADKVGEGKVYRFTLEGRTAHPLELFARGLKPELHQIDWIEDRLYVLESELDAVRMFDESGNLIDTLYPHSDRQARTIDDQDYCRFNSVFFDGKHLYLVAHNRTRKTGKPSALWILDSLQGDAFRSIRMVEDIGGNSHNFIPDGNTAYYCDSMAGDVVALSHIDSPQTEIKFHCDCFTRGLVLTDEYIAIGASKFGERWERDHLGGKVFILDRDFREICRVDLPECGQVYEIRAVDQPDYGLSNAMEKDG